MGLTNVRYPNLELLDYKVRQMLLRDEEFVKSFKVLKGNNKFIGLDFDTTMFPQIWGSTCTGFDVCEDGSPTIGGCAMTKEYTTVFHEQKTDTYVVCFGERPCYKVTDVNLDFLNDLKNCNLQGLSGASKKY